MKKFLAVLFAIGFCVMLASCERTCVCRTYTNGQLVNETTETLSGEQTSCSVFEFSAETGNVISEVKCN